MAGHEVPRTAGGEAAEDRREPTVALPLHMISSQPATCTKAHDAAKSPDRGAGSCVKAHEGPLREAQNGPACALPADPEQALVVALARAIVACRAAGHQHAARVAWRALGELLARSRAAFALYPKRLPTRDFRG